MSDVHRSSHKNQKAHHLYAIKDKEDTDKKIVVKFGISSDEIEEDGLSDRIRRQLKLFNAVVGWVRFYAVILIKGIIGRKKAEDIENEHIADYEKEHGEKPRANFK